MYKANPCLWKVKSKEYTDKNRKLLACEKLAEKLREKDPAANFESVVKNEQQKNEQLTTKLI
jgi:hypothetical protein